MILGRGDLELGLELQEEEDTKMSQLDTLAQYMQLLGGLSQNELRGAQANQLNQSTARQQELLPGTLEELQLMNAERQYRNERAPVRDSQLDQVFELGQFEHLQQQALNQGYSNRLHQGIQDGVFSAPPQMAGTIPQITDEERRFIQQMGLERRQNEIPPELALRAQYYPELAMFNR
jgi:hypothetical protein